VPFRLIASVSPSLSKMAADVKNPSLEDRYILEFLMQSYSLNELLSILESICENLEMRYLNPNLKHFRYLNLTFFGVLARCRSLLEKMIFRAEVMRRNMPQFSRIHVSLLEFDKTLSCAHTLIMNNKMKKGKEKIIEAAHDYSRVLKDITDTLIDSRENHGR